MRLRFLVVVLLATAPQAFAADVTASPPQSLSVTLYRNPSRGSGSISLSRLGGFALVTETRRVRLPAGESRLRFQGVVDGIQPESAILSGLPDGVIEKNRDAALLSPQALVKAAVDFDVTLERTNRKTGKTTRARATVRSANGQGVTFETQDGIETLRCSGIAETFEYSRSPPGLSARPTLSALTRTDRAVEATVTLSYLANGFDWAANYVATIQPDGETLELGGWITLANSNSVSLPDASLQIVAGGLRRIGGQYVSSQTPQQIIARCWPAGTTSDTPDRPNVGMVSPYGVVDEIIVTARRSFPAAPPSPVPQLLLPPPPPPPEDLGDVKLYREPATTLGADQSKQVRLVEQMGVPFTTLSSADLQAIGAAPYAPATVLLRMKNSRSGRLGLPLPSGSVTVFVQGAGPKLLLGEARLRDTAVGEEVELKIGDNPSLKIRQKKISETQKAPLAAGLTPALGRGNTVEEVEIVNALDKPAPFELHLKLEGSLRVTKADRPLEMKDGQPLFSLMVPASGSIKVRYSLAR